MRLGIMSDSHGDEAATAAAVVLLEGLGAEYLIHCGDICGEGVLAELAGRPCTFVWGNCDRPTSALRKYVVALELPWPRDDTRLTLADRRIAVYHGHERGFQNACRGVGVDCDIVFYGHTHQYADQRIGGCRFINPGALYRARPRTCALLDLADSSLQVLRIDNGVQMSL